MEILRDIIVVMFLISGTFFFFVGVTGLIRLPDVFSRMHATTKCDTLGAGLVFTGIIVWQGFSFISLNIIIVLIFIWMTNPTAAHYIAKVEYERKYINQQAEEDNNDHS